MSNETIVRTVDKFNKVINVANMEDAGKIPSGSLLEFVLGRKRLRRYYSRTRKYR